MIEGAVPLKLPCVAMLRSNLLRSLKGELEL